MNVWYTGRVRLHRHERKQKGLLVVVVVAALLLCVLASVAFLGPLNTILGVTWTLMAGSAVSLIYIGTRR
jgi:hypothetical protein